MMHSTGTASGVVVVVGGGVVVVVVGGVVVGTAHGSTTAVSAGSSTGTSSGAAGVVVVTGAVGGVSTGWAKAADPPAATINTVVPATRHRRSHLCRDMTEPPVVCESICYLLLVVR
ncbi:hypothetical protein HCA61_23975 [Rhodococcus sp. HNM0563]|uniref:hypothetical protein n=1 Tax=Rhodococcus sp. HNM0563 TaxID=2716339 RepID=UPI00146C96F2|nr:hypothetical protein [Rhodococcus sp. HNM0563]NLU65293.1 hypothetical protein [Rhodococcus sp. HNM0563]